MADWPVERYPILFHNLLASGGGVVPARDLPWAPSTARRHWYAFVRATKDRRHWRVEASELGLVISVASESMETARKVLAAMPKNFRNGG